MDVGIRELKTHLSDYVRLAEGGETITVTLHGRAVARLVGVPSPQMPETLARLVEQGTVRLKPVGPLPAPLDWPPGKALSDIVSEQRR